MVEIKNYENFIQFAIAFLWLLGSCPLVSLVSMWEVNLTVQYMKTKTEQYDLTIQHYDKEMEQKAVENKRETWVFVVS